MYRPVALRSCMRSDVLMEIMAPQSRATPQTSAGPTWQRGASEQHSLICRP